VTNRNPPTTERPAPVSMARTGPAKVRAAPAKGTAGLESGPASAAETGSVKVTWALALVCV
jgi:hypothetical protein